VVEIKDLRIRSKKSVSIRGTDKILNTDISHNILRMVLLANMSN